MIKYSFPAAPVTYRPPANTPAVLAGELIEYQACPLCESKAFRPLRSADCSHHPRYSQELSRTMHWSQCTACQHVFRSGYYTEAALNIVFRGTNESQVVGYDLERQRYVSAQMVEKVLSYQTGGTWLDVGFGNASLLFTAQEYGFDPVGLDLRPQSVEELRRWGVTAHCQDVTGFELPRPASVISMADVLEHMPFPKVMRPRGSDMRIYDHYDWGTLARIHMLDDRQYRDVQACPRPGRSGSNTVPLKDCPQLVDPKRSLLGADQEQWLAQGWRDEGSGGHRPWNLLGQQTLMARFSWSDTAQGGSYWTDGWDGYAPSRNRLLGVVAERKLPGVVVLGGDVHAHYVADLKADYDDAQSPVIATEFCGTSISSQGMAQSRVDAARPFNPHVHYGRADQRGYVGFTLGAKRLDASLFAVVDPKVSVSAVNTAARFSVEAGRPGVQPG